MDAQAKQAANGAAPASEVTRSPASKAGLDPSAPAFVPGAAQHSPCRAAASPPQAACQQPNAQASKKRSSEDANLEEMASCQNAQSLTRSQSPAWVALQTRLLSLQLMQHVFSPSA